MPLCLCTMITSNQETLLFAAQSLYEELDKYPNLEEIVDTPNGKGIVEKIDIFNGVIYIRLQNNDIEKFSFEELQV